MSLKSIDHVSPGSPVRNGGMWQRDQCDMQQLKPGHISSTATQRKQESNLFLRKDLSPERQKPRSSNNASRCRCLDLGAAVLTQAQRLGEGDLQCTHEQQLYGVFT